MKTFGSMDLARRAMRVSMTSVPTPNRRLIRFIWPPRGGLRTGLVMAIYVVTHVSMMALGYLAGR